MSVPRAVPPHGVDRPELRARLDIAIEAPLSLLVAPAGSGKTVLLRQWTSTLTDVHVVWLEMTEADSDAVHFARRFVDELASAAPGPSEMGVPLGIPGAGLGEALVEGLAASFETAGRIVVVFDDLHRLTNDELVSDLWRLVDMLPPNVHFVFASRVDLKLGWSRHRLHHGLVELRQADLAFSADTAARVLARITRAPVDLDSAATVVEKMEGWAAGVQLTGLTLRFRSGTHALMDALVESDRLALDYLSEEVLDAQSPERREALLHLSVLDEMTPALAEIVTGAQNGDALLRELERESMFVVETPGTPGSYRFHHVFRNLLRLRLRALEPGAESELLAEVARWHLDHDDAPAAIECLLAGSRWQDAMRLILASGRSVYERSETATVARWLAGIPAHVRAADQNAEMLYAIAEGMSGRAAITEGILRGMLSRSDVAPGVALVAHTYIAACVQFRPHPHIYLRQARTARELLRSGTADAVPDILDLTDRATLAQLTEGSLGWSLLLLGDLAETIATMRRLIDETADLYAAYRVHAFGILALAEGFSGCLELASAHSDEALELARDLGLLVHPAPAAAYLARALVAIQRGEPESGAFALHEGYVRAAANRRTPLMWIAHALSRLVDPRGTDPAAVAPPGAPPPLVENLLGAIDRRALREAGRSVPGGRPQAWSPVAFEETADAIARGDIAFARGLLDGFERSAHASVSDRLEFAILRSWLASAEGDALASRDHLASALAQAAREGLVHPFFRAGQPVITLLTRLPGQPTGVRRDILDGWASRRRPDADGLSDPLTVREVELLAFLPTRMTNSDMAAACFVSVNTIKTHMGHIYRKLGVTGRDAAVARAQELGLLTLGESGRVLQQG